MRMTKKSPGLLDDDEAIVIAAVNARWARVAMMIGMISPQEHDFLKTLQPRTTVSEIVNARSREFLRNVHERGLVKIQHALAHEHPSTAVDTMARLRDVVWGSSTM